MNIGIIGAGPAGMTAAYQLSKHLGREVNSLHVFEVTGETGGMARTIERWGHRMDLGPHRFFSKDPEINALWLEVVGEDYDMVKRITRIYYNRRFFHYPIQVADALKGLGGAEALRCTFSYLNARIRPRREGLSFEEWTVGRFGRRLYEIFFKTYSEKLWGIPCRELDADFATQRIRALSFWKALRHAMPLKQQNQHATLVDAFAYPTGGSGRVYEIMRDRIKERGGQFHFHEGVDRVLTRKGQVCGLRLESGREAEFDHIISTMPLNRLVRGLPDLPAPVREAADRLRFRNTILVYVRVENSRLFPDQWLYIHEASLRTGRITNFRNWVPSLYGESPFSILCLEYWCDREETLWSDPDETLVDLARKELEQTGLVRPEEIRDGHVLRIPRCYPVYFRGYAATLDVVRQYLAGFQRLHPIGRYGSYKYNNQDHSILMGMKAAENIVLDQNHDLWAINTDYGVYQESGRITETGLVIPSPEIL
ncbi:MAG: FAD-dependent oxidoreductase [Bacteroidales bacterium]